VKQSEVQTDMSQKFNYFTQCKKQHVKNSVKFKQTCPRSSTTSRSAFPFAMKAEIMILSFSNLLQNDRNIICVISSPRSEKVKKNCERGLYKKNIICVSLKKMDGKITNKNMSQKSNVKTAGSSTTMLNEI
jgi:hypothetical protein